MAGIIGDVLALSKSHSNLDYYYGPYTTLEETYSRVPKKIRGIVPIIHNDNNEKKFLYSTYVVEPSI